MDLKKPELIAGKQIPKWSVPEEDLASVLDNIQNKSDTDGRLELLAADKERRKAMGLCLKCRNILGNCLCHYGGN